MVIPQAFLRARLRLERPPHSEKTQNYISHVQQLQFFLFLIAAEWDLTTVFQAANGIHTPNTDLKTGLQSKLGTTFSAEKMSPRNGLKSTIRSSRPEKNVLTGRKQRGAKRKSYGTSGSRQQRKAAGCRVQCCRALH